MCSEFTPYGSNNIFTDLYSFQIYTTLCYTYSKCNDTSCMPGSPMDSFTQAEITPRITQNEGRYDVRFPPLTSIPTSYCATLDA